MTMPVALEPRSAVSHRDRALALAAVAAARPLARLSPRRLRQVLRLARRGARPASAERALAARRAVVVVSVRCAGQGCLQRSIATALLCRFRGAWPVWCAGVRTEPFQAHAWVETGDGPVGEADDVGLYRKIMTVPPVDGEAPR
ncbi:lasso peptide biosynthesis B2 protein [Spirillospora sp. NPDC050679]